MFIDNLISDNSSIFGGEVLLKSQGKRLFEWWEEMLYSVDQGGEMGGGGGWK